MALGLDLWARLGRATDLARRFPTRFTCHRRLDLCTCGSRLPGLWHDLLNSGLVLRKTCDRLIAPDRRFLLARLRRFASGHGLRTSPFISLRRSRRRLRDRSGWRLNEFPFFDLNWSGGCGVVSSTIDQLRPGLWRWPRDIGYWAFAALRNNTGYRRHWCGRSDLSVAWRNRGRRWRLLSLALLANRWTVRWLLPNVRIDLWRGRRHGNKRSSGNGLIARSVKIPG